MPWSYTCPSNRPFSAVGTWYDDWDDVNSPHPYPIEILMVIEEQSQQLISRPSVKASWVTKSAVYPHENMHLAGKSLTHFSTRHMETCAIYGMHSLIQLRCPCVYWMKIMILFPQTWNPRASNRSRKIIKYQFITLYELIPYPGSI